MAKYPDPFLDAFTFFQDTFRDSLSGLYYDNYNSDSPETKSSISIGSTGFGLVICCIGDVLKLTAKDEAVLLATKTVDTLLGLRDKATSENGFFAHWLDPVTGAPAGNKEFSTIDTALMAAGALFARNYFRDSALEERVNTLVRGIKWGSAVVGSGSSGLYMTDDPLDNPTKPFNEYFMLAYVGKVVEGEMKEPGAMTSYFSSFYSNPPTTLMAAGAHKKQYYNFGPLWSDTDRFASSFVVQFCYYLSTFFQQQYYNIFLQFAGADWLFFRKALENSKYKKYKTAYSKYEWGCGAGAYPPPDNYKAVAIDNDDQLVYSPPIIAGFFPADEYLTKSDTSFVPIEETLSTLYQKNVCTNTVDQKKILWRRSICQPTWNAPVIQSVDFSTLLLGYAWKLAETDFFKNAI